MDITVTQGAKGVPTCRMISFYVKSKPKHSEIDEVGTRRALLRQATSLIIVNVRR